MISQPRISFEDARCDGTTLVLGDMRHHIMPTCSQKINEAGLLTDCTDFDTLTIDQVTDYLNLFQIMLPFNKDFARAMMDIKLLAQKVPGKAVKSETIYRYIDKIQVVAVYEDLLKPTKEFNPQTMYNLINQLYTHYHLNDMTNWVKDLTDYDLSNMYFDNSNFEIG